MVNTSTITQYTGSKCLIFWDDTVMSLTEIAACLTPLVVRSSNFLTVALAVGPLAIGRPSRQEMGMTIYIDRISSAFAVNVIGLRLSPIMKEAG